MSLNVYPTALPLWSKVQIASNAIKWKNQQKTLVKIQRNKSIEKWHSIQIKLAVEILSKYVRMRFPRQSLNEIYLKKILQLRRLRRHSNRI